MFFGPIPSEFGKRSIGPIHRFMTSYDYYLVNIITFSTIAFVLVVVIIVLLCPRELLGVQTHRNYI